MSGYKPTQIGTPVRVLFTDGNVVYGEIQDTNSDGLTLFQPEKQIAIWVTMHSIRYVTWSTGEEK